MAEPHFKLVAEEQTLPLPSPNKLSTGETLLSAGASLAISVLSHRPWQKYALPSQQQCIFSDSSLPADYIYMESLLSLSPLLLPSLLESQEAGPRMAWALLLQWKQEVWWITSLIKIYSTTLPSFGLRLVTCKMGIISRTSQSYRVDSVCEAPGIY